LIGSIPTAYLAGRLTRGVDIRELGDGNSGTANAFRELGGRVGLLVGVFDISKGFLVVLIARQITGSETAVLLAGLIAVIGHSFPIYLGFRGGRGAATALGVLLILMPRIAFPIGLLAGIPLAFTRNTNVFFAITFAPMALFAWLFNQPISYVAYSLALPVLVGIFHFISSHRSAPSAVEEVGRNLV